MFSYTLKCAVMNGYPIFTCEMYKDDIIKLVLATKEL